MNDALLILDWGIGGIGAFIELRKQKPDLDILYCSDSGSVPYGKMSQADLSSRILKLLNTAQNLGASHALIACNAGSTILPFIEMPIPTIGVIEKGVEKLISDKRSGKIREHVGIIGGKRTIDSGAWTQPLIEEGFRISAKIAQPLSAIIESGKHLDSESFPVFESVLEGLEEVTDLVLACTHYVAAAEIISRILPNVTLFDPVDESVNYILEYWMMTEGTGKTHFSTTGSVTEMEINTKLAYGINISGLVKSIENLKKERNQNMNEPKR